MKVNSTAKVLTMHLEDTKGQTSHFYLDIKDMEEEEIKHLIRQAVEKWFISNQGKK